MGVFPNDFMLYDTNKTLSERVQYAKKRNVTYKSIADVAGFKAWEIRALAHGHYKIKMFNDAAKLKIDNAIHYLITNR